MAHEIIIRYVNGGGGLAEYPTCDCGAVTRTIEHIIPDRPKRAIEDVLEPAAPGVSNGLLKLINIAVVHNVTLYAAFTEKIERVRLTELSDARLPCPYCLPPNYPTRRVYLIQFRWRHRNYFTLNY